MVKVKRQTIFQKRIPILRFVGDSLAAIDQDSGVSALHLEISSIGCIMLWRGLSLNSCVFRTLEEKGYCTEDLVFRTIRAYIDRASGFRENAKMANGHPMYFNMVSKVVSQNYGSL